MKIPKNMIWNVLFLAVLIILAITGTAAVVAPHSVPGPEGKKQNGRIGNLETGKAASVPGPLREFGTYLEGLYREGYRSDLEKYVISGNVYAEEYAELSGVSPVLEHLGGYAEDPSRLNSIDIRVIAADINGDGIRDVIEYGPADGNQGIVDANTLIIYLGTAGGEYRMSYSQLFFDTRIQWNDTMEAVRYKGENYLLFDDDFKRITDVYWLSGGIPCGKLELRYGYREGRMEVLESVGGYSAGRLSAVARDIYRGNCVVSETGDPLCGTAETGIPEGTGQFVTLTGKYDEKYQKNMPYYQEKYGTDVSYLVPYARMAFSCDINNDGKMEEYKKAQGWLWLQKGEWPTDISEFGTTILTGEMHGIHEGREGLVYYMESSGEETGFWEMCGLNIWGGERTPQYFYVDGTDRGNVTYIIYQDRDEHLKYIEGYLIQGDTYERVLSARYTPEAECRTHYVTTEEKGGHGYGYFTYLSEDCMSIEIKWGGGYGKEGTVNRNIREFLGEKMETVDVRGGNILGMHYDPLVATDDTLTVSYYIYFDVPWWDTTERETSDYFSLEVDLLTGECRELTDDERYSIDERDTWW